MKLSAGALASGFNIAFSIAAFALGIIIVQKGGSGGADALAAGVPVLSLAELCKLVIGACLFVQTFALGAVTRGFLPRVTGSTAAVLMLAAGGLGIAVITLPPLRAMASWINPLALFSVAMTGLWALTSVVAAWKSGVLPLWLRLTAVALAVAGLIAPVFPPAALAAFVAGVAWNSGVGMRLSRRQS
ncbi:MAG TPA: hypothetical protein VLZ84_03115 [Asticcacaulis sp.]|nr:hypothetical protein [Asticcacaulis sp.]